MFMHNLSEKNIGKLVWGEKHKFFESLISSVNIWVMNGGIFFSGQIEIYPIAFQANQFKFKFQSKQQKELELDRQIPV